MCGAPAHMASGKQDCKVFIGGLSWETSGDRLRSYFENFGAVREAFVSYNRNNGRPRGFGFVVFESSDVADKVVAAKHTIDRREVEAKKAVPKDEAAEAAAGAGGVSSQHGGSVGGAAAGVGTGPGSQPSSFARTRKIFVGGLAPGVDEPILRAYFEEFGEVEDAVVMYDHENKRPRGFGFVQFTTEEAVDRVFGRGSMQTILDKPIEIKSAVPRDQMPAMGCQGRPFGSYPQPPPRPPYPSNTPPPPGARGAPYPPSYQQQQGPPGGVGSGWQPRSPGGGGGSWRNNQHPQSGGGNFGAYNSGAPPPQWQGQQHVPPAPPRSGPAPHSQQQHLTGGFGGGGGNQSYMSGGQQGAVGGVGNLHGRGGGGYSASHGPVGGEHGSPKPAQSTQQQPQQSAQQQQAAAAAAAQQVGFDMYGGLPNGVNSAMLQAAAAGNPAALYNFASGLNGMPGSVPAVSAAKLNSLNNQLKALSMTGGLAAAAAAAGFNPFHPNGHSPEEFQDDSAYSGGDNNDYGNSDATGLNPLAVGNAEYGTFHDTSGFSGAPGWSS